MIKNLLDEIIINIQDNLDENKYKSVVFKNDNKVSFLIYEKENYLKTPLIQINFSQGDILHIYANIFIKSQKSSSFVLIINQNHPDSTKINKENNELDIADFISYVSTKIKSISTIK